MTILTGDHIADIHDRAAAEQVRWACVDGLPVPWLVDQVDRFVYVDGRLPSSLYFEALSAGLDELLGAVASVTTLYPRLQRDRAG
jgi:hypothetical protein